MRVWVAVALSLTALAGCAGTEEPDLMTDVEPEIVLTVEPLGVSSEPNGTVGAPFWLNITWMGDGANVTWTYEVFNTTTPTNVTMPWTSGNGTGLPATFNITFLEAGNHTVAVTAENQTIEHVVEILAGAVVEDLPAGNPCEGIGVQDGFAFSGATSTVTGTTDHLFTVGPCQTHLVGSISYLPTGGDVDIELIDPSGKEVDSAASFDVSEGDVEASGDPYLMEGDWIYRVVPFASPYGPYDVTITFG